MNKPVKEPSQFQLDRGKCAFSGEPAGGAKASEDPCACNPCAVQRERERAYWIGFGAASELANHFRCGASFGPDATPFDGVKFALDGVQFITDRYMTQAKEGIALAEEQIKKAPLWN